VKPANRRDDDVEQSVDQNLDTTELFEHDANCDVHSVLISNVATPDYPGDCAMSRLPR
jgi:hypothetical protein